MSGAKKARSAQGLRGEHSEISRGAIVALAVYIVLTAGLLVYVRRYAPEHPGIVYLEVLGFPVLVLLVFILRKRRG
jgi:hypothetical protein